MEPIGKGVVTNLYLNPLHAKQNNRNINRYSGAEMTEISSIVSALEEAFERSPEKQLIEISDNFMRRIKRAIAIKPAKRASTPKRASKKIAERDATITELRNTIKKWGFCIHCGRTHTDDIGKHAANCPLIGS